MESADSSPFLLHEVPRKRSCSAEQSPASKILNLPQFDMDIAGRFGQWLLGTFQLLAAIMFLEFLLLFFRDSHDWATISSQLNTSTALLCTMAVVAVMACVHFGVVYVGEPWTSRDQRHRSLLAQQPVFMRFSALRSFGFAKSVPGLWAALVDQLPPASFMISYSWETTTSKDCAQHLGALFDNAVCWLDTNDLVPGDEIKPTCKAAVTNSLAHLVIISQPYLESPNCIAEWEEICKQPARAIVFVDDLTPGSLTPAVRTQMDSFPHVYLLSELRTQETQKKMPFGHNLATANQKKEWRWLSKTVMLRLLLDTGVLRQVLQSTTTPPVNIGWLHTAAALTAQPVDRLRQLHRLAVVVFGAVLQVACFHYVYVKQMLKHTEFTYHPPIAALTTGWVFVMAQVLACPTRNVKSLDRLPDSLLLFVVLRCLGLCDKVSVFTNNPIFGAQLRVLESLDCIDLDSYASTMAQPASAEAQKPGLCVLNIADLDKPLPTTSNLKAVYWSTVAFSELPQHKQTQFKNVLLFEHFGGSTSFLETIGVLVLRLAFANVRVVTGAYPFRLLWERTVLRRMPQPTHRNGETQTQSQESLHSALRTRIRITKVSLGALQFTMVVLVAVSVVYIFGGALGFLLTTCPSQYDVQ